MFGKKKEEQTNDTDLLKLLDQLETEKPDVFRLFIAKQAVRLFNNMPWYNLWDDETPQSSGLMAMVPFITPILVVVMGVIILMKK